MHTISNNAKHSKKHSGNIFSQIGVLQSSKPKKNMQMTCLPPEYYSSSPYIMNQNIPSQENLNQSKSSGKSSSRSSFEDECDGNACTTIIIHANDASGTQLPKVQLKDDIDANIKGIKPKTQIKENDNTDDSNVIKRKKSIIAQFLDEDFDQIVQAIKGSKTISSSVNNSLDYNQNSDSKSFLKDLPSSCLERKDTIDNEMPSLTIKAEESSNNKAHSLIKQDSFQNAEQEAVSIDKPKQYNKTFLTKKSISPKDMLHQHDDEVKQLTNTIEISNFYEYTKSCMKMIINIADEKYTSPAKVSFPFEEEMDKNGLPIKKRLAVFDLDETLVHCLVKDYSSSENIIEVMLPSKYKAKVGVNIRPHWQKALKRIQKAYHIVVYTASHQSYADAVLNFLDPDNKFFPFRLYRNNCIVVNNNGQILYVKDCSIFKDYDLKDVVLVDNSVLSFAYHLYNGIPIVPYYDAKQDFELLFCACYLESIVSYEDVRAANRKQLKLEDLLNEAFEELEKEKMDKIKKKKNKAMTPQHQSKMKEAKSKEKDRTPTDKSKGKGKTPTNKTDKSKTKKSTFSGLVNVYHKNIQVNEEKTAGDSDDN